MHKARSKSLCIVHYHSFEKSVIIEKKEENTNDTAGVFQGK